MLELVSKQAMRTTDRMEKWLLLSLVLVFAVWNALLHIGFVSLHDDISILEKDMFILEQEIKSISESVEFINKVVEPLKEL